MLDIIPAIDLMGGQAVRLQKGDFASRTQVADDPVETARQFAQDGATRLHIVDLDGARTGDESGNRRVIADIIRQVPALAVQVGGGVRSLDTVQALLDLGAVRVVVGTSAAQDEGFAHAVLARFGDQIIIGADVKNGKVAVRGWQETTGETGTDFARRMAGLGAQRFLFTDVARDGMLEGANIEGTVEMAQAAGVPVLASGGVAGLEDIVKLRAVQPNGVEGVIIGKALYAGKLTLADALRLAQGEPA